MRKEEEEGERDLRREEERPDFFNSHLINLGNYWQAHFLLFHYESDQAGAGGNKIKANSVQLN